MDFCCKRYEELRDIEEMLSHSIYGSPDVSYYDRGDDHGIDLVDRTRIYEIFYCPFCGKKLE